MDRERIVHSLSSEVLDILVQMNHHPFLVLHMEIKLKYTNVKNKVIKVVVE